MEEKKLGFFKKLKIAIFDLENYTKLLNENFGRAFLYLIKLLILITIAISISSTVQLSEELDKFLSYIKTEAPDFSYNDGTMSVTGIVKAYDKEYDAKLIANTSDVTEEQLEEYKDEALENGYSAIVLKDKALISANGISLETSYKDLFEGLNFTSFKKADIVSAYEQKGFLFGVSVGLFVYSFMVLFVQNLIVITENILIVALFAWLASKLSKASLSFKKSLTLSIYALTLSNILSAIYSIVYAHLGFEIKYFDIMYLVIAYIYVMAVILMNKVEIIEMAKKEKKEIKVEETVEKETEEKDNKDIKNEDNKE